MERALTNFIRALRSSEVAVSPAEAIDAARAIGVVGYGDRAVLKHALGCVLAKSPVEKETYSHLFDLYFSREAPNAASAPSLATVPAHNETDLLSLMQSGDEAAIQMALEGAAQQAGIEEIRFATQVSYYAAQMVKAMGGQELGEQLLDALRGREGADAEAANALIAARKKAMALAREKAEAAFEIYGRGETQIFRDDFLASKSLSAIDQHDMQRMRPLIAKIARRLAAKHSRRRKKRNRGQLDIRRSLRANAKLGGVPFNIHWRQKKRQRPSLVVLCDVSGSVAKYVHFLLLLLYALHDAIPKLHAFAFSNRLEKVGHLFDDMGFEAAMSHILKTVGMGSTSYGQALSDWKTQHWRTIDRHTTLIILGDGRSNYSDPRIDIISEAAARAKRTIWLCPERESLWGTGDSEMNRYKPFCSSLTHVATIKDLERAIDDVLAAYH